MCRAEIVQNSFGALLRNADQQIMACIYCCETRGGPEVDCRERQWIPNARAHWLRYLASSALYAKVKR
jgi:hypothetical protein